MGKFNNISAFIGVVEHGSFSEAARQMGLSRSQVNKAVIALEDQLGVLLLNRTTRKVSTTPYGDEYYVRVKKIINDLEDADNIISEKDNTPKGILKLNAPQSFGVLHLAPALSDFMILYPEVKLELTLSDRFVDLIEEGYDATVRIGEINENSSLIDHPIIEIKRYILASPDFIKKYGPINHPDQLKTLPCLHYGTLGKGQIWPLSQNNKDYRVKVNGIMCANNGDVLCDAAVKGLGVTMLPTFIAGPMLHSGKLVRILPDYTMPEIHLMLLYAPNRHLSLKIRKLIEFLYDRFGDRPYWDLME